MVLINITNLQKVILLSRVIFFAYYYTPIQSKMQLLFSPSKTALICVLSDFRLYPYNYTQFSLGLKAYFLPIVNTFI